MSKKNEFYERGMRANGMFEVLFAIGKPFEDGYIMSRDVPESFLWDEELLKRELYALASSASKIAVKKFKELK